MIEINNDVAIASALPNIDDRKNVIAELNDLGVFVEDGALGLSERPLVLSVRFGRPHDQERVRCHPDPERCKTIYGIKDKINRGKIWVLSKKILPVFPNPRAYLIRQAINLEGDSILWPAPLPHEKENQIDEAHRQAQFMARHSWIRLEWTGKTYAAREPVDPTVYRDPKWPEESFDELLALGLRENVITDTDHPLVRVMLGR